MRTYWYLAMQEILKQSDIVEGCRNVPEWDGVTYCIYKSRVYAKCGATIRFSVVATFVDFGAQCPCEEQ